jgi:hypothetical protein
MGVAFTFAVFKLLRILFNFSLFAVPYAVEKAIVP